MEESLRSVEAETLTTVEFINRTSGHMQVFWIDYTGQRVMYNILWPGESYQQKTYLTHPCSSSTPSENVAASSCRKRNPAGPWSGTRRRPAGVERKSLGNPP